MSQLQPFLPAKEFSTSEQFYRDFGAKIIYQDAGQILFELDGMRFFVQRAYIKVWAENLVLQWIVNDVVSLYQQLSVLIKKYPMIKVTPIHQAHYGETFTFLDPAGVLWHVTKPHSAN